MGLNRCILHNNQLKTHLFFLIFGLGDPFQATTLTKIQAENNNNNKTNSNKNHNKNKQNNNHNNKNNFLGLWLNWT